LKYYGRLIASVALAMIALAGCGDGGKTVKLDQEISPEQRAAAQAMIRQMRGEGAAPMPGQPPAPPPTAPQ
jgi:hypothetical protein